MLIKIVSFFLCEKSIYAGCCSCVPRVKCLLVEDDVLSLPRDRSVICYALAVTWIIDAVGSSLLCGFTPCIRHVGNGQKASISPGELSVCLMGSAMNSCAK